MLHPQTHSIPIGTGLSLEGVIFHAETASQLVGIEITGWGRDFSVYVPYFAAPLGTNHKLYLTNMRQKGEGDAIDIIEDIGIIDKEIRDLFHTNHIAYLGHSAAVPLMITAAKKHGRPVLGHFCMNAFPSLPDVYKHSQELPTNRTNELLRYFVQHRNSLPKSIRDKICPEALDTVEYSFEDLPEDTILRFVNSYNDGIIQTLFPSAQQRLTAFCTHYDKDTTVLEGDHLYNTDDALFNETSPYELLKEAESFFGAVQVKLKTEQAFRRLVPR